VFMISVYSGTSQIQIRAGIDQSRLGLSAL